jgi:predicted ArsR family transcriptional regulator
MTELPLLERRRIEAGVLVPMVRALQAEFGEERVNEIVGRTIREIAHTQGAQTPLSSVPQLAARFEKGVLAEGSLIVDVVERSDEAFGFNVTRCKFVEMYEEMGARDLGFLLSCNRDFAAFEGMAPELDFNRTQTRMQGASHCDFRYHTKEAASPDSA